MELLIPLEKHKQAVLEFKQEFEGRISGGVGLEQAIDYSDWLSHKYIPHYGKVDELIFLAFENDELVGISDVRLSTNEFILNYAGQIGYSVRPSKRGRGYATKILELTLKEASKYFSKVLITCNETNIASSKVIERNSGILQEIVPHPGYPNVKRYCINLNNNYS